MSYREAEKNWATVTVHYPGDATKVAAAKAALIDAAGTDQRNKEKAEAAILVFERKQANSNTYESRALGKVKDGMKKSSVGNFVLGCINTSDAF